ncbi:MAG: 2-oxoisovalerate dehydrogenase [Planctomycetota bacterium]|nr:MAG: 2-oxoisovalerate dehydrogenase [Planctomycetota bacterium]
MALMSELIFVVEEAVEGGYTAKALGASIFTEADSLDELRAGILDAVRCHFGESERPKMVRLHLVRDEVLPV